MITRKGNFRIKQIENTFRAFKNNVPKLIANKALNHFLEGFRQGGKKTDASKSGWAPRKRISKKERNKGRRAILEDEGDLKADIRKREVTQNRIVVGTLNIKYAIWNNEGTEKLPQREFIGESRELEIKIKRIIENGLKNIKP